MELSQSLDNLSPAELDQLLERLAERGYRISREFKPRTAYTEDLPPQKLVKAMILDTETTGTDPAHDKIIELGIVLFEYCPDTGQVYRVLETFNGLEDPGMPIPPESTKVHGITDEMVRGKRIDDNEVVRLLGEVSLVIAHNAKFDRVFIEARFPDFVKKGWACSFAQVPWTEEGLGSAKLEFLAYRYGFYFTGHRASNDCHALLEVLQRNLPESGIKAMKRLLENARERDYKVWALGSPFDSKDALKERGYRWNPDRKVWVGTVAQSALEQEKEWLKAVVYGGRGFQIELEKVDAFNRFSDRQGLIEKVDC